MRVLLIAITAICLAGASFRALEKASVSDAQAAMSAEREGMYLPRGEALQVISLGYTNILADILWFDTISYFGKHYATDKNFAWLFHMCDLITTLDPKAQHVYQFCSNMLSWETRRPDLALKILDKAISHFPDQWKYFYLRGFTKMFFMHDNGAAHEDFVRGARLPGAPAPLARLAAKKGLNLGSPAETVQFLKEMIHATTDPLERRALEDRLTDILRKIARGEGR